MTEGSTQRQPLRHTAPQCAPLLAAALSGVSIGDAPTTPGRGIAVHMSPGPMRGNISYPQDYQFVRTVVKHEKSHLVRRLK